MMLEQKQLAKPTRKLRQAIKKIRKVPSPEEVHALRTQTRRLEAVASALKFDETKRGRRLIGLLAPMRKAAGKVRDVDVLTGLASTLSNGAQEPDESLIQLLEELGAKRLRSAKRLYRTATSDRDQVLRELKWLSNRIDQWIEDTQAPKPEENSGRADPAAAAISLSGSLAAWKKLDRNNLHPYRMKIKELRYMLELAQCPDKRLLEALGKVKDAIGAWHDWCELEGVARALFEKGDVVKRIHVTAERRFKDALKLATTLQKTYFVPGEDRRQRSKHPGPARLNGVVLAAAAQMSA